MEKPMTLNELRDEALRIAVEHGFTDASVGEDIALMHSELSEALEDYRDGRGPRAVWYETKKVEQDGDGAEITIVRRYDRMFPTGETETADGRKNPPRKPCGTPSEMADVIIRVLHFCGKHGIDIEQAVREKMAYNESRPIRHGGKAL